MDLNDATVLVTGANRGIGSAIVAQLADRPVRLVLAGVRDPAGFAPVSGRGVVRPVRMDLSSAGSIEACVSELGDEFATVDMLVNNAGQMTGGLLEEQDMQAVYAMLQVNLVAVAHLTHLVLPAMLARRRGKIVNNASISGYAFFPGASTYAASKAGVVALSESLRRELRGTGVGVLTVITPGVNTDMLNATEQVYSRHMDTSGWDKVEPDEWATRIMRAIDADETELSPGGKTGMAKLASRGPSGLMDAVTARMFSRRPRA